MAEVRLDRLAKRVVRPLRLRAAVEDSVRMRVLTAVEGIRESLLANALAKSVQSSEDGFDRGLVPVLQQDERMNVRIARIGGSRLREVDEIAIEVDVLLGDARLVREAPGILRMKEHDRGVLRQARPAAQPGALRRRARVALDAVRAAADHEDPGCVARAEHRDVEEKRLALGPPLARVVVCLVLRAGAARRAQEVVARLAVGVGVDRYFLSHRGLASA